jgi:hypothetical protein
MLTEKCKSESPSVSVQVRFFPYFSSLALARATVANRARTSLQLALQRAQ